jgi:hypothetical protein
MRRFLEEPMKLATRLGSVALIAVVAGSVFAACSGTELSSPSASKERASNSVGLALQPVAGVTLNSVHYVVSKAGQLTPVLEGDLPTPGNYTTLNVGLPIPVGTGYTLSLSAVSIESALITCAGVSGPFDVLPNQTTRLSSALVCVDPSGGTLNNVVSVTTDACPRLIVDYLVITPNYGFVSGPPINVFSQARDLDGKPVTYAWKIATASVGSFAAANAANTSLACKGSGVDAELTLTASNGQCQKSLATTVSCSAITCGNGQRDPGEPCDPSVGDTFCKADCTVIECGNGIVEAPLEQCDPVPPDPANCTSSCKIRKACGDGFLSAGEACDGALFPPGTPLGATCNAACQITIDDVECGNGVKGSSEVCDPPLTVNNCGRDCRPVTLTACLACDNATECIDFVDCGSAVGNAPAGTPGAGTPRLNLCSAVLDCVRDSGCAAGGNNILNCYCGTATVQQCQTGQAKGICKTELERGLETTVFNDILAHFKDGTYGGGVAMARIDCEQNVCKAPCGLN